MGVLEELKDLEDIRRLKKKYSQYLDERKADELADLFTEDAVTEWGTHGGTHHGLDAIRAAYRDLMQRLPTPFHAIHVVVNDIIDLEGDEASGLWYLLDIIFDADNDHHPLQIVGRYRERYRREAEGWKITYNALDYFYDAYSPSLKG